MMRWYRSRFGTWGKMPFFIKWKDIRTLLPVWHWVPTVPTSYPTRWTTRCECGTSGLSHRKKDVSKWWWGISTTSKRWLESIAIQSNEFCCSFQIKILFIFGLKYQKKSIFLSKFCFLQVKLWKLNFFVKNWSFEVNFLWKFVKILFFLRSKFCFSRVKSQFRVKISVF